jgi:anti-sigma factor ChrR (cupin superfamily)
MRDNGARAEAFRARRGLDAVARRRSLRTGAWGQTMLINADFDRRVVLHAGEIAWQASPSAGVSRRPLDRIGDEVARATTIVRFDPGSRFAAHAHGGGEEFLVLEGVFQDESGDFPAGAYVRNPPQSRHTPASEPGCVIFVKLWQFDPDDRTQVRVDLNRVGAVPDAGRPGVAVTPLYRDGNEDVRVERLAPGAVTRYAAAGGAELLVLEGAATESGDALGRHSWVRIPPGGRVDLAAGPDGAVIWVKTGHLRNVSAPAAGAEI